jgi:hypothetical protein
MQSADDFRFASHQLLRALDASTIEMMKLVAISAMGTAEWFDVVRLHQASFTALHLHLHLQDSGQIPDSFAQGVG